MAVAALIVEDGTGIEDADAYVDVEYVRTYFANLGDDTFTAEDDDAVIVCIRGGTQFFEANWATEAVGDPTNELQGLTFPLDDEAIPKKLKQAIAELAKMRFEGPLAGPGAIVSSPSSAAIKALKAGTVEVSFSEARANKIETEVGNRFYLVEKLIASFMPTGTINSGTAR